MVLANESTIASSIYIPAISEIMRSFHVSSTIAILPYSLYVLGLAFGPMIGSPCSETFGRRVVYLVSIPIFALFMLGSGFSKDIVSPNICRFFAGVFGSPGLNIGSATISDIWPPTERAIPMTVYVMMPFLAPSLGPLLGGYAIIGTNDWASIDGVHSCVDRVGFCRAEFGDLEQLPASAHSSRSERPNEASDCSLAMSHQTTFSNLIIP
jgi:MFS family permease